MQQRHRVKSNNFMNTSPETSLSKCQQLMDERGWDLCIVATPVNIFYLLGYIINGYVVIRRGESEPWLFVRRPAGLKGDRVRYFRKPEEMPALMGVEPGGVQKIALELDTLSYAEVQRVAACFAGAAVENADTMLRQARSVKMESELAWIRQCGRTYCEAFRAVPELYRPGMSDHEFALAFEALLRRKGHIGIFRTFGVKMESFMGSSILVGDNADAGSPYDFALGGAGMSPMLPVGDNGTVLREGQTMMVDGGGCFGPYMTDMTRVFALGVLPELAIRAHECSVEIHRRFRAEVKAGASCADLYNHALAYVREQGLESYFMGHQQQASFIGHGVGLQINELPVLFGRSKEFLQSGMVVALEPKFVIPGVGAVGVENTYIIHSDGVECVTAEAPEEIVYL
jgi:Xaa-Pro aminopeptidase